MKNSPYQPDIYRHKTAVMQRIQQLATRGYEWYISGEVAVYKATALAQKFSDKYQVDRNENQRNYAKRMGRANTFLLMYPKPDKPVFLWWLLATKGEGMIHQTEPLLSVVNPRKRLVWQDDYELVQVPREGVSHPVMTWRMTRKCYKAWYARIRAAVRKRHTNELVRQAIWTLYRAPGFSEIRKQVKQLTRQLMKDWQRIRSTNETIPPIPANIGYVRGMRAEVVSLFLVASRMGRGKRPFPNRTSSASLASETNVRETNVR